MDLQDLTIILPTKNEAANIRNFLTSIPPEIFLIVIDSSEDETPAIIRSERPKNSLVHCVPAKIAAARHLGAQMADSSWLVFTDADVIFAPDYFQSLAHLIKNPPDAKRPSGAFYGAKLSQVAHQSYYRSFSNWLKFFDRMGIPAVSGSNLVVNRNAYFSAGGFDRDMLVNEDTELGFRIKRAGFDVRFIDELIVYVTDHRRLRKGGWRKDLHSAARCSLLYLNLMPLRWRKSDWGYWTPSSSGRKEV